MKNITDKEIVNVLLNEHKLAASSLTSLVLESVNQNLRNDVTSILTKTFEQQKRLFDVMNQKGWYQVQNASPQDITKAQQEISKVSASMTM